MKKYMFAGKVLAGAALVAVFCTLSLMAARPSHTFAQKLVEQAHARHPEASEIGIAAQTAQGCRNIASTDPGDVGEACEREDVTPMHTGRAVIGMEGRLVDASLPLHDAAGRLIGSAGIELKPKPGESRTQTVARARAIVAAMEREIPSRAKLLSK